MRYLLTPALALCLLCACKKDEAKPAVVDPLVGAWQYRYSVRATDTTQFSQPSSVIAFDKAGSFKVTRPDNVVTQSGTWRKDGDSLRFEFGSSSAVRLSFPGEGQMKWLAKSRSDGGAVETRLVRQ
jgi:outer membrane biogenesis lipoprotein LolB